MLYTMFDIGWKLFGDILGITFLERYADKLDFLDALPIILNDYRRLFSALSDHTSDEALDNAILEASAMRIAPDVENLKLTGQTWQIGICTFKIYYAEHFPEVMNVFREAVKDVYPVVYKNFTAMRTKAGLNTSDAKYYTAYQALRRVNSRTSQKSFERTYDLLADCLNYRGNERTARPMAGSNLPPADTALQ